MPVYILCEDKRYERGHKQHKREALKARRAENPEEEEVRLWEDASVPWPDSWRKHRKPWLLLVQNCLLQQEDIPEYF